MQATPAPTPTPTPSTTSHWFADDESFNQLYPARIRKLAERHWTKLEIAKLAANFLAPSPGTKVLDIGSGVGKFCLAAAHYRPDGFFYGIEQRADLVKDANTARETLLANNTRFVAGNFTALDFHQYHNFYFYNSFYENLVDTDKIDEQITFSEKLYTYYTRELYRKLSNMPVGTRLVTFHTLETKIPTGYILVEQHIATLLKCWMKVEDSSPRQPYQ